MTANTAYSSNKVVTPVPSRARVAQRENAIHLLSVLSVLSAFGANTTMNQTLYWRPLTSAHAVTVDYMHAWSPEWVWQLPTLRVSVKSDIWMRECRLQRQYCLFAATHYLSRRQ